MGSKSLNSKAQSSRRSLLLAARQVVPLNELDRCAAAKTGSAGLQESEACYPDKFWLGVSSRAPL